MKYKIDKVDYQANPKQPTIRIKHNGQPAQTTDIIKVANGGKVEALEGLSKQDAEKTLLFYVYIESSALLTDVQLKAQEEADAVAKKRLAEKKAAAKAKAAK